MRGIIDAAWMNRAACHAWPDLPWTTDTILVSPWDAVTMRTVCDQCPVRPACIATAMAIPASGGWWAGVDRDPDARQDFMPSWVPITGLTEQGVLPLDVAVSAA